MKIRDDIEQPIELIMSKQSFEKLCIASLEMAIIDLLSYNEDREEYKSSFDWLFNSNGCYNTKDYICFNDVCSELNLDKDKIKFILQSKLDLEKDRIREGKRRMIKLDLEHLISVCRSENE